MDLFKTPLVSSLLASILDLQNGALVFHAFLYCYYMPGTEASRLQSLVYHIHFCYTGTRIVAFSDHQSLPYQPSTVDTCYLKTLHMPGV